NFGSPEDPEIMWQFAQAVESLAGACQDMGIPVTGGNVSLYNQTGGVAIHPTPVVGVLGVFDDVTRATPSGWREPGQTIYLLGTTEAELDGSAWAEVTAGHLGGFLPRTTRERGKNPAGGLGVQPAPGARVLGVVDDGTPPDPGGREGAGQTILLGGPHGARVGRSAWAGGSGRQPGGVPPQYKPEAEKELGEILINC